VPEVLPDDVSDVHDDKVVYEDPEARGSDMKELRSGAPRFPTRSSLVTVGTLILIEGRDSRSLRSFPKNTWRRLRKNRVIRTVRSLWGRVDGFPEM